MPDISGESASSISSRSTPKTSLFGQCFVSKVLAACLLCSAVSIAPSEVGLAQFVYLVLFSYTYFFESFTGLAITILCILTLFVVTQFTGRVDWDTLFRKQEATPLPE